MKRLLYPSLRELAAANLPSAHIAVYITLTESRVRTACGLSTSAK